jgi:hypothetical protein
MPTQVLAPGTTEASSSDITVEAGTPVNVGAYRDDEQLLEPEFRGLIYRKDAAGDYNPTNFSVHREKPNQVIVGPGIYQVRRTGAISKNTGIQTD